MGKSVKAKKEKKSDFQKSRLKVGKTKAKSDSFTDTSFRSRTINVLQQNLSTSAPTTASQFSHHLSLLNHKSESQRRDSLSYLTSIISSTHTVPQAVGVVLSKVQPLIFDSSAAVRTQCLQFLEALPPEIVRDNVADLILFARAALMHLSDKVNLTGLDVLEWLLNTAGQQVVITPGGWTKTVSCMMSLLNWSKLDRSNASAKGWKISTTSQAQGVKTEQQVKARIRQLQVLALLLTTGLVDHEESREQHLEQQNMANSWPLWQVHAHNIAAPSLPYAALNLWGEAGVRVDQTCSTVEERFFALREVLPDLLTGLQEAKKEGGGLGRAAMSVDKIIQLMN